MYSDTSGLNGNLQQDTLPVVEVINNNNFFKKGIPISRETKINNLNLLIYLNWKTDLLRMLKFLCVHLCAGAETTLSVAGREQVSSCLLTRFVCHPAEA